jgi:hypothetical protein
MPDFNLPQRHLVLLFMLALSLIACSSAKPPDDLFQDDIEKMVLLDRELGFREEISEIKVLKRQASDERVEVVVRVTGWASHPDLKIGATLPTGKESKQGWATWKYFCRKIGKEWKIEEKYKVDEGY